MIYTSYYSLIGKYNKKHSFDFNTCDLNILSIAVKPPDWYNGPEYLKLAPPKSILYKYKKDGDEEAYTKAYYEQVLNKLDPEEVLQELTQYGEDVILLCWEASDKFCHRHLIAKWLEEKLRIKTMEVPID